jgi:hypothetical protein
MEEEKKKKERQRKEKYLNPYAVDSSAYFSLALSKSCRKGLIQK